MSRHTYIQTQDGGVVFAVSKHPTRRVWSVRSETGQDATISLMLGHGMPEGQFERKCDALAHVHGRIAALDK